MGKRGMTKRTLILTLVFAIVYYACFFGVVYPMVVSHAEKALSTCNEVSEASNYSYAKAPCNNTIRREADIPHSYYYAHVPACANDVLELDHLLSNIKYPHAFEPNVFDCSESAAFLEWHLQNRGYDAAIMVGARKSSEGKKAYHAWVVVRNLTLEGGKPVAMHVNRCEGAAYFAVMSFYYQEDQAYYEDIYEACESHWGCDEWDWWNAIQDEVV